MYEIQFDNKKRRTTSCSVLALLDHQWLISKGFVVRLVMREISLFLPAGLFIPY